jgi:hypothetical protein
MSGSEKSKSEYSESTLGDFRNDPDVLNDPNVLKLTSPQQNGCSCDHVVRKLQENMEILMDKMRKLEAKKKCILSEEEKVLMCKKKMLQLLEYRVDYRVPNKEDDVILFLKALSAGEKCVNLKIQYDLSPHQLEDLLTYEISTDENILPVFRNPVSINGWTVQFHLKVSVIIEDTDEDSPPVITYCIILTTPEKTKLHFVAQSTCDERKDGKMVSLPTTNDSNENDTGGFKIFGHVVNHSKDFVIPMKKNVYEQITWTVINQES